MAERKGDDGLLARLKRADEAWRGILDQQSGIYAALRVLRNKTVYCVLFLSDESIARKVNDAYDAFRLADPYLPDVTMMVKPRDRYVLIKEALYQQLARNAIDDLLVLHEPGMTRPLRVRDVG